MVNLNFLKNEKNGNYYYIDKDLNKVEIIENQTSCLLLIIHKLRDLLMF
jgi:hypothetical protein